MTKGYDLPICQELQKVTKVYLNILYLTLSLCYNLRKSYSDPKSCMANLK